MRLLLFFFLMMAGLFSAAQENNSLPYPVRPRLNVDAEFVLPAGEAGHRYSWGIGAAAGIDAPVTQALYASLSAGLLSLFPDNDDDADNKLFVPIKVGAKYYFNSFFYGQAEMGTAIGVHKGAGISFIMSPGVGVSIPVTDRISINGGLRFETWNREGGNINGTGFKVGLQF